MILLQILEHDLHRQRRGLEAVPLLIEIPARPEFLPALVSNSIGKFIISRKLTKENRIRTGVFPYNSDKIDDIISNMIHSAYRLSIEEKWPNVFRGKKAPEDAFNYIKSNSVPMQPHVCLIPLEWTEFKQKKFFGCVLERQKYQKYCRIVPIKTNIPTFLSRPDMVGMYTQFMGGKSSILLHNIKLGMSFCAPDLN
jgi:hypothetical protein